MRDYRTKGQGVSSPYGKPTKAELARIEELGKLNDDWNRYRGERSRRGLFRVAARYRRRGMFMMAALVQSEALSIEEDCNAAEPQQAASAPADSYDCDSDLCGAVPNPLL